MKRFGLYFAWLFATIGFLASLYFSEVRYLLPCELCWYQRICLYPLVIILGIATYRGAVLIVPYVLPQVIIGLFFALYQVGIQEIPNFNPIELCGQTSHCTDKIDIGMGFVSLPILASLDFALILICLIATSRAHKKS